MHTRRAILAAVVVLMMASCRTAPGSRDSAIVRAEFIAEQPPTPSAHASTIVETDSGLLAAWFGGTREGAADVGIWTARYTDAAWSAPTEVATGLQPDGTRLPCYNPVLFHSADGVLHLFYKVGPAPSRWWGMHRTSRDEGRTWSAAERLPDGILGPVKNRPVVLGDGTIVSGSSTETPSAPSAWRVHFELSRDNARTWTTVMPVRSPSGVEIDAIQPSVLVHRDGRLQAIGRTKSRRLFETWSSDGGNTWSALALMSLPNPNAGTDAMTLRDGRHLVVYNPSTTLRTPLAIAVSSDGKEWRQVLVLESTPGEYSYPAVIQARDGMVHVTYTWRRQRIRHVVVDPVRLPR